MYSSAVVWIGGGSDSLKVEALRSLLDNANEANTSAIHAASIATLEEVVL
ncbi:MAG: hypothetical protein JWO52_7771 [Gammaproteobacteria bacterium]|jgi:hypothetical protein|nr:hypothetical protein [Gammaproteobacteria bacterium]